MKIKWTNLCTYLGKMIVPKNGNDPNISFALHMINLIGEKNFKSRK